MSKKKLEAKMVFAGPDAESGTLRRETKVGRNDPCPCGSGKKAKNCCGVNAVYKYNKFRYKVTKEGDLKKKRPFPFEIGETVLTSDSFPTEDFRGKQVKITERGFEERIGNFYFKVAPVDEPGCLVDFSLWYADGHLVKPEHYGQH